MAGLVPAIFFLTAIIGQAFDCLLIGGVPTPIGELSYRSTEWWRGQSWTLAHRQNGYRRGDLREKRRLLMNDWASPPGS